MKAVYKLDVELSYANLSGLFVADDNVINYLINNRLVVHFGEVAGKHSYISGILDSTDVILITYDEAAVKIVKYFELEVGYNPLEQEIVTDEEGFGGLTVGKYILHKLNNTKP
jgi:hypothetical protein